MDKTTIPHIQLGEYGFEGTISLEAWRGFQSRQGFYASKDTENGSDGLFRIQIGGDMVEDNPKITPEHIATYWFLIENQESIKEAID